jgi:hypothetical protein
MQIPEMKKALINIAKRATELSESLGNGMAPLTKKEMELINIVRLGLLTEVFNEMRIGVLTGEFDGREIPYDEISESIGRALDY